MEKLLILLTLTSLCSNAGISIEQEVADCLKINTFAANGDKHYKIKDYSKAREQYEKQVAWSEQCQLDESRVATAYNNVALTYIREADFLKANAWIGLCQNDNKSTFNASSISREIKLSIDRLSKEVDGEYWQYAGKSFWNVIKVNKVGEKFRVNFKGYYAGLMAMYYGPNVGEFSALLDITNRHAYYSMSEDDEYLDCVYHFTFTNETLTVERASGDMCGFGYNVSADGVYHKVGL